jgi:hypothetical protein
MRLGTCLLAAAFVGTLAFVVWACSGGEDEGTGGAGDCGACAGPGLQCCPVGQSSVCLNTNADLQNCGACGEKCDALKANRCESGACRCGSTPACGAGTTCCEDEAGFAACADFQVSRDHCGGCGNKCDDDETCQGGQCLCNGATCQPDEKCCGGTCVKVQVDNGNCGNCGNSCGAGTTCTGGMCKCTSDQGCGGGETMKCCGGECVDVCTSSMNCGYCGRKCTGSFPCFVGMCFEIDEDAGVPDEDAGPPPSCGFPM